MREKPFSRAEALGAKMMSVTSKIGPIWDNPEKPEWPMYSYERPADLFWNAVAEQLEAHGFNEQGIKDFLQSKNTRWMLDQFEDQLTQIAKFITDKYLEKYQEPRPCNRRK